MSRLALALALLLLPAQAIADDIFCEQPWFLRNLIFDRAGYCFSSPLGQAVFDNSDCTGTDVTLSPRDEAAVAHIRQLEEWSRCEIDALATRLEHMAMLEHFRRYALLPIPVEGESGCIGYRGPRLPLLTAPGAYDGPILGELVPNADIHFGFLNEGTWDFVTVYPEGWSGGPGWSGWVDLGSGMPDCRQFAG